MTHKMIAKRRVFINKGKDYYQLFSFSQHDDGSIYSSMPEFANIKWMSIVKHENEIGLVITNPLQNEGKLSVHGSGMTTYRAHADSKGHQLIVKGNFLMDKSPDKLGVRHLFTSFFQEPKFLPQSSPALNRENDYLLNTEKMQPFVMAFFAVPTQNISVQVSAGFHINDIESVPPETGWGGFNLRYHTIVWFYYRTKYMESWPANTHICYHDGFTVPFFIGTDRGECRLEIRTPTYTMSDGNLIISIPMPTGISPE